MQEETVLDVSWGTILKAALVFFGFYVLYLVKDILISILFAFIISILFNPAISFLERFRVPRVLATIAVHVIFFGILSIVLYQIIPVFIGEIQDFIKLFPQYFEKLAPPLRGLKIETFDSFETFTQALQEWLIRVSSSIFGAVISIFGGILSTITIFSMAIFFSIEEQKVKEAIELLVPRKNEAYFLDLWDRCQNRTAAWFGTRVLSSIIVGFLSFITLKVFSVEYAAVLSVFSGIMDIVPVLGPIFATIVVVLLALLDRWYKGLFVLIAYILIQQIEGNIITPLLTKRFVGLPAILVLIALLVGGRLWGVLGAVLTIPLISMIYEFLRDFLQARKEEKAQMV